MALTIRYSATGPLKMVHTGNTVGMSANSIYCATGITLNPSLTSNVGITSSYSIDTYAGTSSANTGGTTLGSWACLAPLQTDVPSGSTVVFAVLTVQAYSPAPSGNVTLIDPSSTPHTVALNWTDSYSAAANVTTIVANGGMGNYAITNLGFAGSYDVHGIGWGILIAYTHPTMPIRSLSFYTGFIQNGGSATASGFSTPSNGIVKARVYAQSVEANYFAGGDTLTLNNVTLSGPYNPATNFFNNQVCDYTGLQTTVGSFAQYNVPQQLGPNPYTGGTYARDMFDITNVSADGALANGNTSTTVAIGSSGDVLFLGMLGLEINANQAYLAPTKYVDKSISSPGNTLVYTLVLNNQGGTNALTGFVQDTLPSYTTLVPNSLKINGVSNAGDITQGINLGSVPYGAVYTLTYLAIISPTVPLSYTISNFAFTETTFRSINNGPIYTADRFSNIVDTVLFVDNTSITKSVDKTITSTNVSVTYTIVIENNDTQNILSNIKFIDSIPNTTAFISNTFTLDGVILNNTTPQNGIFLNTSIPPLGAVTLTFQVNSNGSTGSFTNTGAISYDVILPSTIASNNFLVSNTVTTTYGIATLQAVKSVNQNFTTSGQILTYTIVATNTGNLPAVNVMLTDTIPNGTTFVNNSITLNGTPIVGSLSSLNIGTISPNEVSTIGFKVLVN